MSLRAGAPRYEEWLLPETLEGLCLARATAAREDCVDVVAVCRLALDAVTVDDEAELMADKRR